MIVRCALIWLGLFGLCLVLAGQSDALELGLGAICASLGATLAVYSLKVGRPFSFEPPLRAVFYPLLRIVTDTWEVGVELTRVAFGRTSGQRGEYVVQPFEPGGESAVETGRRAVVVLGLSLGPGCIVVRGEDSDILITHTFPPKSRKDKDTRWPT